MNRKQWMMGVVGVSLLGSGILTQPANARPNLSDISGTNVFNNVAPIFEGEGRLSVETLEEAQRLVQELEEASAACCNNAQSTSIRRFARGARDTNAVCVNPNCEELEIVVEAAQIFLDNVNRQVEQLEASSEFRSW